MDPASVEDELPSLDFRDIAHGGDLDTNVGSLPLEHQDPETGLLLNNTDQHEKKDYDKASWFSPTYYQQYFDFTTMQIVGRLKRAMIPFSQDGFYLEEDRPDLYSPFWIATTLVFLMASTGNFASYLDFQPANEEEQWVLDFEEVTFAASIFYSVITVFPLVVYLAYHKLSGLNYKPSLPQIISLYGYSLFVYIPTSILCVLPMNWLRWILILLAFLFSIHFLLRNVFQLPDGTVSTNAVDYQMEKIHGYVLVGGMIFAHFVVAVLVKMYFFSTTF